jgi:hypothetical protein
MSEFGILSLFTNQKVIWRPFIKDSRDKYGRPAYDPPIEIKCRIAVGREAVRDIAAPGVHADCAVMTRSRLNVDDLVEYGGIIYKIKSYSEVPWLGGQYIGRFALGDRYAPPMGV